MAPKENSEETVESPRPGSKDPNEPTKPTSKIVRILTVFMYVLSVSLTAILLSIYYIFLWKGEPHQGAYQSFLQAPQPSTGAQISDEWINGAEAHNNLNSIPAEATSTSVFSSEGDKDFVNITFFGLENITLGLTDGHFINITEMQQQLTAVELGTNTKNSQPTTASEESITWPEEYDSLEELSRSSTFMRKIMEDQSYQE